MSEDPKQPESAKKTLDADDILTERQIGRRSTLGAIGATLVGAAAITSGLAAGAPESAEAQTDSDTGRYADRAGQGRTGVTDSDSGDRAGHGRGRRRPPPRPPRSCTDSDSGQFADPGGQGRNCGRRRPPPRRNCSDSDSGQWADPGGQGRRC